MQLPAPFFQLPLRFDATRLAAEVAQFTEAEWRPHPQGHPGNSALPYIARLGNPLDDGVAGPMRPTPHLARCPYLMQVMAALDVTLGRSRLMRLDARAEATPHVDLSYYWQQRVRVHIPVVTFPDVRFLCGEASTHMAAGECWIFDTWRVHNVLNPANARRIHLVIDTVGSARFWQRVASAGAPSLVAYQPDVAPALRFESWNYPVIMPPAEAADLWARWIADARQGRAAAPAVDAIDRAVQAVFDDWRAAWAQFGAHADGWGAFAQLRERLVAIGDAQMNRIELPNKMDLANLLKVSLAPALMNTDLAEHPAGDRSTATMPGGGVSQVPDIGQIIARATPTPSSPPGAATRPPAARAPLASAAPIGSVPIAASAAPAASSASATAVAPAQRKLTVQWGISSIGQRPQAPPVSPRIVRPLIIVAAPRSGSTLLFETLAHAPDLYTVGGESHEQFESIAALQPGARGPQSNRAVAADATPAVVSELNQRFWAALRDRDGGRPAVGTSPRVLEKTPKNALRVPFLEAAFPGAQYVYLYRDPEENVSSMIEGWESGHFVMYSKLPGWRGLPWSFLLVPGWQDLVGADVPTIAASQWQRTQTLLLDDLEALPRERVHALTYAEFLATPSDRIRDICAFAGLQWDRPLPPALPLSRHTVSAPRPDKWRQREALIAPHRAALQRVADRAKSFIAHTRAVTA